MKLLRWVVVTLIIAAFAYGITEALCGKMKASLIKSGGLVLASDLAKLEYAPIYIVGVVIVISFVAWLKKE